MFEFLGAVAAALAVAAPVVKNLGEIAQGGRRVLDFAGDIWKRFRQKVPPQQQQAVLRQALAQAAAMPQAEFDKQIEQVVAKELPEQSPEDRRAAAEYLKLMPARIRTTFIRPDDPTGTTVPVHWNANKAEDLVPFLPPRAPRFREGDIPPGASNWILTERLGLGGFGEVWKARSKTMQSTFRAFKFCLDPVSQDNIIKNEMMNIELVQTELADHPHIVKLIEAHIDGDTPWLQYEYVPGGDLGHLVSTWGNDLAVRAQLAVEKLLILAETLAHCHAGFDIDGKRKLVIHRDMKPANVLIGRNGTLKITDFGISNTQARQALDEARIATVSSLTCSTPSLFRWASTPMYASEQQQNGETAHTADDVHALGVMLYQMILGNINRPLNRDYIAVLERKHVCRELIALLSQSIASDRQDRYQHAGELAEALKRLPKKLIVEPVKVPVRTPEEEDAELRAKFDIKVKDAAQKNEQGRKLFEQRQWKPAKAALDAIFHPILRNAELYKAVSLYAEGKRLKNSIGMEFVYVPAGESWLGGGGGTPGTKHFHLEEPRWCGIYPVTQAEWQAVQGKNPSKFSGNPRFPVEQVSWDMITKEFLPALNKKCQADGYSYILPTEDEWEYICRGGPITEDQSAFHYYFARSKTDLTPNPTNDLSSKQANFDGNHPAGSAAKGPYLQATSEVGLYLPNPLGIYDLVGNVWEWTSTQEGSDRVFRGGSWHDNGVDCTAAHRNANAPGNANRDVGFRLLAVPVG